MQLIRHASLHLFLQNSEASVLKECHEVIVGAHHAIVGLVQKEGAASMHVFFDEN